MDRSRVPVPAHRSCGRVDFRARTHAGKADDFRRRVGMLPAYALCCLQGGMTQTAGAVTRQRREGRRGDKRFSDYGGVPEVLRSRAGRLRSL